MKVFYERLNGIDDGEEYEEEEEYDESEPEIEILMWFLFLLSILNTFCCIQRNEWGWCRNINLKSKTILRKK